MKPLHVHCLSAEPMRRLEKYEPGRSVIGDLILTVVFGASVAFFVAFLTGIVE